MRTIRHYVEAPLLPGTSIGLPESAVAHLVRVLRLGVGDEIVLFNGDGFDYRARLAAIGKKAAEANFKALGEALESNTTLAHIYLPNNRIGDHGACDLAEAVEKNRSLLQIQLAANQIGDRGAQALSQALAKNATLETLHLSANSLMSASVKSALFKSSAVRLRLRL